MNTLMNDLRPYMAAENRRGSLCSAPPASHGKRGYLRLGFELDSRGRSILRDLERRAPLIVQQELYFDECMPEMPCVYILSSGGPNVDGDRYEQHFEVRRDACAHISTGAATKLAEMRSDCSSMRQTIRLEEGAYMEYLPEPVIPCRHTRFASLTDIEIAPTATLVTSEIYMGGRRWFGSGELFAYDILSVCTRARRPEGEPLFREKFVIRPQQRSPSTVGVMNGCEVFANVTVLTPQHHADAIYRSSQAFTDRRQGVAAGVTRLPGGCGVILKLLANDSQTAKRIVRRFCSSVRQQVKGRPLFDEFPWR